MLMDNNNALLWHDNEPSKSVPTVLNYVPVIIDPDQTGKGYITGVRNKFGVYTVYYVYDEEDWEGLKETFALASQFKDEDLIKLQQELEKEFPNETAMVESLLDEAVKRIHP